MAKKKSEEVIGDLSAMLQGIAGDNTEVGPEEKAQIKNENSTKNPKVEEQMEKDKSVTSENKTSEKTEEASVVVTKKSHKEKPEKSSVDDILSSYGNVVIKEKKVPFSTQVNPKTLELFEETRKMLGMRKTDFTDKLINDMCNLIKMQNQ